MLTLITVALAGTALAIQLVVLAVVKIRPKTSLFPVLAANAIIIGFGILVPQVILKPLPLGQIAVASALATAAFAIIVLLVHVALVGWILPVRLSTCNPTKHWQYLAFPLMVMPWLGGWVATHNTSLATLSEVAPEEFVWRSEVQVFAILPEGRGRAAVLVAPRHATSPRRGGASRLVLEPDLLPCWRVLALAEDADPVVLHEACLRRDIYVSPTLTDLRGREAKKWKFELEHLARELTVRDMTTGSVARMAARSLFLQRGIANATVLPGDQVVLAVGEEVVAIDWATQQFSSLGRGFNPVAVSEWRSGPEGARCCEE